ncbi:MAG: hypothetical protein IJN74_00880 [Clostridia bacterium]|nr:hypothetical protein [Clostridia bacterium]
MKKLLYFLPAIPFTVLLAYFAFLNSVDTTPVVWVMGVLLILSGLFLCKNKWWGCFFGIIVGGILIYMGLQETGQIFKEYIIGFPLVIFYAACGIYVAYKARR